MRQASRNMPDDQMVPEGWVSSCLGEVAEVVMGNSPPGDSYNETGLGVPLINGPVEFSKDALGPTVRSKFTTKPTKMCSAGDLLVCVRGATAGRTNVADFDACIGRGVALVRARIDQSYVNRFVIHSRRKLLAKGTGTTFPNISRTELCKLPIPVPPLNEQRRIVAKIEALFARSRRAKEALDAIPPLLDRLRQSILAAAFRGDLTADWRAQHPDVEPADKLLERIRAERRQRWEEAELAKMAAKGKVPKNDKWKGKYTEPAFPTRPDTPRAANFCDAEQTGWSEILLDGACDPERGIPYGIVQTGPPTDGGIATVRCGDIKNFDIDVDGLKLVDHEIERKYIRTRLQGGEVLVAIRGTVGGTAVATGDMRGMNISREVAMVPVLTGLAPRFVMYLLASPAGGKILAGHTKGVAQRGVNLSDLRNFPVPLPTLVEQDAIVARVESSLRKLDALRAAVSRAASELETLRASVLREAFEGRLVSQDANDKPVSSASSTSASEWTAESLRGSSPR